MNISETAAANPSKFKPYIYETTNTIIEVAADVMAAERQHWQKKGIQRRLIESARQRS